ncbi:MAG TPA: tripartite tricarboxylate transporter substrate binding protein [Burkholderiales bacterium]
MLRVLIGAVVLGALPAAFAQGTYPSGPISLIIPLAAGDATDIAGRAIGDALARELKVPVIAVNKPGAGGALGTDAIVKASKDGHTIGVPNNAALVFREVVDPSTVNYEALKDLTPLGLAMRSPSILVVGSKQPFHSFREMVDYGKKNPGKVRIGTAGIGSVGDFCVQTINSLTGAGLTMVPYKGAAPAVTDMRGGQIEGVILALGAMRPLISNGTVRGLLISSKWDDLPDVPTLQEVGYSQPLFGIWTGFFGPAGLPSEVTNVLVPALERAVRSPEIAARLKTFGIVADWAPPEKMVAEMREEQQRVREIAKAAGLIQR